MIHVLLRLFCINFILLQQVFHLLDRGLSADNGIHPLNNCSQTVFIYFIFIFGLFSLVGGGGGGYLLGMGHLLKRGINSISWNRYRE